MDLNDVVLEMVTFDDHPLNGSSSTQEDVAINLVFAIENEDEGESCSSDSDDMIFP